MKKYPYEELFDVIETTQKIVCNICNHESFLLFMDEVNASEILYIDGWRKPRYKVYCPKCAEKKLKKKK